MRVASRSLLRSLGTSRLLLRKQLVLPSSHTVWPRPGDRAPQQPAPRGTIPVTSPSGPTRFVSVSVVQDRRRSSMSSGAMSQRMVWVDLEGPNLIIKQPDELLEGMSEWCKEHHGKSGLTQAVRDSNVFLEQAEYEFLSFVRQHTPPGQCPLAGNSVHADKRFLDKFMPQFMFHLHYRIIDVSTIKELSRRWFPEEYKKGPHKRASHRALDDIHESIRELQYYRGSVFRAPPDGRRRNIMENGGSGRS
ncbi:small fragment nuclease isoform X4 [Embiotoca jacksoni]|uniref:small fragment nuclease isoform X4 n=1 Tax=Embiotoca jacksoni TaxID=100190 RepID=UPI003704CE7C